MNNEVRNKMHDFEINPPAGSWEKILHSMEVLEEDLRIAGKMNAIDILPPADTWSKISNTLSASEEKGTLRGGKIIILKRFAVAAVLIGIIAVSAIWIINKSATETTASSTSQTESAGKETTGRMPSANTDTVNPVVEKNDSKNHSFIANVTTTSVSKKRKQNIDLLPARSNRSQPEEKLHSSSLALVTDMQANTSAPEDDRYYNLLDENGNIVRVSRKLASMQCVIKNVSDIPFANTPEEIKCLAKINEWRNKMATAPAFTSPLDLIRVISAEQ